MKSLYSFAWLIVLLQIACSPKNPTVSSGNSGKYFDARIAKALGAEAAGWISVKRALTASDFGAIPDDRKDDTEALQKAFDYGEVLIEKGVYNVKKTLLIKKHGTQIKGQSSVEIVYTGVGSAISSQRINKVYPVSCELDKISITLTKPNQVGFDIKMSSSQITNCSVKLTKVNNTGFQVSGDASGTGSYYNNFIRCNVQGNDFKGTQKQKGIEFTFDQTFPSRCPNANVFIGGRIGQVSEGLIIRGAGNNFYSPVLEGVSKKCMVFDHPTAQYGCLSNNVYSPYIEGGNGATAAYFGKNARNCEVLNPFYTSLGATGILEKNVNPKLGNGLIVAQEMTSVFSVYNKDRLSSMPSEKEGGFIRTGKGTPKGIAPNGTLYSRTDGKGQLYLRQNGKWILIK